LTRRILRRLTPNSQLEPKLSIRRDLLARIVDPAVIETHAGQGILAKELGYDRFPWLPIDNDRHHTHAIHWDSREVLRALDLNDYNFFDIDAYGSPLEWAYLVSQHRNASSPFALAMTCGAFTSRHKVSHTYRQAGFSAQMLEALGDVSQYAPFAGSFREDEHTIPLFRACLRHWFKREPSFFVYTESFDPKGKHAKRTAWNIGAYYEPS
jgi:hypothetical protein